ncbi:MAG: DUF3553 domain-containing protein [Deltaproteobacteria bacterium]|nr:DUF3553 domain-containing protein [Deltaproteobacteria bacterium]
MRERDKPRAHVIEPAKSGTSTCQTCGLPIGAGVLRLSEAFVSDEGRWARSHSYARTPRARSYDSGEDRGGHSNHDSVSPDVWARYHHLSCAAAQQPFKLRSALAATTLDIPDRAELERAIEVALSGADAAEEKAETRDEYQGFLARLREAPDDDLMLVFGDWLHSVGDPRGELVTVQRALETAEGEAKAKLHDAEKRLLATHRKRFLPERLVATLVWRRGFVHRMVIAASDLEPQTLGLAFASPSFRLLRELAVHANSSTILVAANLPRPLPATLRVLELGTARHGTHGLGQVGALVANGLPQLEHLAVRGAGDLEGLRSATLATLELSVANATEPYSSGGRTAEARPLTARIAGLEKKKLPALRRLVLRVETNLDHAVAAVVETKLLQHLSELVLAGDLSRAGVDLLARKRKQRLALLDVTDCNLGAADLDKLRTHAADTIVEKPSTTAAATAAPKKIGEYLVRHKKRPEWGIGKVVAESDDGMEVDFAEGGRKQIRNVEFLEEVEAP